MEPTIHHDSWIRRFIIFHRDLISISNNYKGSKISNDVQRDNSICHDLDESSSLDELAEHILYFYEGKECKSVKTTDHHLFKNHTSANAVRFAGLCQALYFLPSSLEKSCLTCDMQEQQHRSYDNIDMNDQTREVQLSNSTIIFMPLEQKETQGLLAVAQVARKYVSHSNSAVSNAASRTSIITGGDTFAIRCMIEKAHKIFMIFNGGGIHHRLSSQLISTVSTYDREKCCGYPGMKKVYEYHKLLRKSRNTTFPNKYNSNQEVAYLVKLQHNLDQLLAVLPITKLRFDLKVYYDNFIFEVESHHEKNGGIGRCLIQASPLPVHWTCTDPIMCAQKDSKLVLVSYLKKSIKDMLRNIKICSEKNVTKPCDSVTQIPNREKIVAISAFQCGSLMFTETEYPNIEVSTEIASIIQEQCFVILSKTTDMLQPAIFFSFRDFVPRLTMAATTDIKGAFLSPPIFTTIETCKDMPKIPQQTHEAVWMPEIDMPKENGELEPKITNIVIYIAGDYSFTIYLHLTKEENDALQCSERRNDLCKTFKFYDFKKKLSETKPNSVLQFIPSLLSSTGEILNKSIIKYRNHLEACLVQKSSTFQNILDKTGIYFLFVDRERHLSIVGVNGGMHKASNKTWNMSKKAEQHSKLNDDNSHHLDSRHLLSAQLPLDIMLAFDDMFHEASRLHNKMAEFGTFLPQGWVYCYIHNKKELFVILNTTQYVTLADMLKAATCFKNYFFRSV
mmetsp:Transcript_20101/g.28294  ORF Transcript_20101/g.28294 Transcript_20101/m.28294 type:complete len:733 (+) Transcript_20101:135-2333(+)